MFWFRIDNRLIHGQVIESWLPRLEAKTLTVVNDALARDELQQQIMRLAVPKRIEVHFTSLVETPALLAALERKNLSGLVLLETCADAMRLLSLGVRIGSLNVGNMHYSRGKRQICAHVAASEADLECFRLMRENGVDLDFRCIPEDVPDMEEW